MPVYVLFVEEPHNFDSAVLCRHVAGVFATRELAEDEAQRLATPELKWSAFVSGVRAASVQVRVKFEVHETELHSEMTAGMKSLLHLPNKEAYT